MSETAAAILPAVQSALVAKIALAAATPYIRNLIPNTHRPAN
jgi:hypothetical protein